eukprot:scaffold5860_cov223-Amphora_coffeaeformis.AAC.2
MADFQESSQLCLWTYSSPEHLTWLRNKANYLARLHLAEPSAPPQDTEGATATDNTTTTTTTTTIIDGLPNPTQAKFFARGWTKRFRQGQETADEYPAYAAQGPWENVRGKAFLNATEEAHLVAFYAPKLGKLIGPKAVVPRLKRNSKVTATAALLYRRFFLSNSVMMYDPKAVMVAAAFLASKVEDASADVRYLEEGTQLFNAHVPQDEIIAAELALIQGVAFDLLCFHPHKAVLALTEDLRTFLKSDKGKAWVGPKNQQQRTVSGQDLEPLYAKARDTLEEALLQTDLALLYTPGQLGLASLMAAQDILHEEHAAANATTTTTTDGSSSSSSPPWLLQIDWHGYVTHRFDTPSADTKEQTWEALQALRKTLQRETPPPQPAADKKTMVAIFKKLKKVRAWGNTECKKRKKEDGGSEEKTTTPAGEERSKKRVKIE